jgi:hypothetical protein
VSHDTGDRHELLKWAALVAMIADHIGKTIAPELLHATHALGRLALPWFAGIVASRLATAPGLARRYLPRLAVAGLVAQPAFAGLSVPATLDVMFTIAAGVMLSEGFFSRAEGARAVRAATVLGGALLAALSEFGPLGAWIVPAMVWLLRRGHASGAWLAGGALAFSANVSHELELVALQLPALLAGPLALAWLRFGRGLPRLAPSWFFYAVYGAHLWLLWAWLDFV